MEISNAEIVHIRQRLLVVSPALFSRRTGTIRSSKNCLISVVMRISVVVVYYWDVYVRTGTAPALGIWRTFTSTCPTK